VEGFRQVMLRIIAGEDDRRRFAPLPPNKH
jgi:hypothetical protein